MKAHIYISKATIDFDETLLRALAEQAGLSNQKLNVSGYLYYEKGRFLQYVEGEAKTVDALISAIYSDTRHEVNSSMHQEIGFRRFPCWYMHQLKREDLGQIQLENLIVMQLASFNKSFKESCVQECFYLTDKLAGARSILMPS